MTSLSKTAVSLNDAIILILGLVPHQTLIRNVRPFSVVVSLYYTRGIRLTAYPLICEMTASVVDFNNVCICSFD